MGATVEQQGGVWCGGGVLWCQEQCYSHLCSWGELIRRYTDLIKISYSSWRVCLIFEVAVTALSNLPLTHLLLTQDRERWIVKEHRLQGISLNTDIFFPFVFSFRVTETYGSEKKSHKMQWREKTSGTVSTSRPNAFFCQQKMSSNLALHLSFTNKRCMRLLADAQAVNIPEEQWGRSEIFCLN